MICLNCQTEFDQSERNKVLPLTSAYRDSSLCVPCISHDLIKIQTALYPELKSLHRLYKILKSCYETRASELSKLTHQFQAANHEQHLIKHNLYQLEKSKRARIIKESKTPSTDPKKLAEQALANLPPEQRAAVLAVFNKA